MSLKDDNDPDFVLAYVLGELEVDAGDSRPRQPASSVASGPETTTSSGASSKGKGKGEGRVPQRPQGGQRLPSRERRRSVPPWAKGNPLWPPRPTHEAPPLQLAWRRIPSKWEEQTPEDRWASCRGAPE